MMMIKIQIEEEYEKEKDRRVSLEAFVITRSVDGQVIKDKQGPPLNRRVLFGTRVE